MAPEAPQVMLRALFLRRCSNGNDLTGAGVDGRGESPDCATLAGGVPSLEYQNCRNATPLRLSVKRVELSLKLLELGAVLRLIDALRHIELTEDRGLAGDI